MTSRADLTAPKEALTRRFGADYSTVAHPSAREALDSLAALKVEGAETALAIVCVQSIEANLGSEEPRAAMSAREDRAAGQEIHGYS